MAKNILIFSDGTGQFGGLKPDQRLSNIYKIYRASRPRPENGINPSQQVAFYDAGLGTARAGTIITGAFLASLALAILSYQLEQNVVAAFLAIPATYLAFQFIKQIRSQFKWIGHYPKKNRFKWHWASWQSKNYDKFLDTNVGYARHARSIDEDRKLFPIVGWAHSDDYTKMSKQQPAWLKQAWFAGNHSDIGGSYPEAESRLSDHALNWMLEELASTPEPMLINVDAIQPAPHHAGLQHDEVKSTRELYPRWVPKWMRISWNREMRKINPKAVLHQSVYDRFEEDVVSVFDKRLPYRPPALREHTKVAHYYDSE